MRAVVYDAFAAPMRVDTLPDPVPSEHGVVIAVAANGLCRSDWHGWQGHDADIQHFPHVPGHELAGTVVAVGASVRHWRTGARVTVPFVCACGSCAPCRRGDGQVCDAQTQPGFTHWGAFADLVAIHHADVNLVALPPAIAFDTAAALGCRMATAYRALTDRGRVAEGQWVSIFGCGGVGLSAVMIARALGARVLAVDVSASALALASQFGADVVIESGDPDSAAATIVEHTRGGADVSMDALGSASTARGALLSLRKNGRHVQVGLLAGPDAEPPLPLHLLISRELEIVGSHGLAAHAYPRLLDLVSSGALDPAQLITRRLSLDDVPNALATMVTHPHAGVTVMVRDAS